MKCVLSVAALLLLAVTGTDGLKCIGCRPNRQIAGMKIPPELEIIIKQLPSCSQLNTKDPELDYEMTCPQGLDSCVKIRDKQGNELRSCSSSASTGCIKAKQKGQALCNCRGDFCNSGDVSAPALLSLFAPLAAVLLRLY